MCERHSQQRLRGTALLGGWKSQSLLLFSHWVPELAGYRPTALITIGDLRSFLRPSESELYATLPTAPHPSSLQRLTTATANYGTILHMMRQTLVLAQFKG